jgi:hypothetical protein
MRLKRKLGTKENREFWQLVDSSADQVKDWPDSLRETITFQAEETSAFYDFIEAAATSVAERSTSRKLARTS